MLEIRLFGAGDAHYLDQPLEGFPNQQAHLLLCYLLLNRHHSHPREQLAAVFWDECTTHTSRCYLRNLLWRLRNALQSVGAAIDDYLSVTHDSVSFLTSSPTWLDIDVFEGVLMRYQNLAAHELKAEQEAGQLEEAVDLYTGDLLEGVYEDWCLYDRERLSLLHLNALSKLMLFHELNGTYEQGLAYGSRILARDHTREKAHRGMMRLCWLLGDRNAALAQYKCCVQIVREELGIAPMQETRLLYELIVQGNFDPASRPASYDTSSPIVPQPDDSVQPLAEHALQRLHRLQGIMGETSAELRHIQRLLRMALLRSRLS
jgi:DNA-binding SARP family transcriptional activator